MLYGGSLGCIKGRSPWFRLHTTESWGAYSVLCLVDLCELLQLLAGPAGYKHAMGPQYNFSQATAWALESRSPTMTLHGRQGRRSEVRSIHKVKQRIRPRKDLLLFSVPENHPSASERALQSRLFALACSRTIIPECYFGHWKPDGPGIRWRGEVLGGSDELLSVSCGGAGSAQIKDRPRAGVC